MTHSVFLALLSHSLFRPSRSFVRSFVRSAASDAAFVGGSETRMIEVARIQPHGTRGE